jgi:error-prone DNA polymerase
MHSINTQKFADASIGGAMPSALELLEGAIQMIVWKRVRDKQRSVLLESRLLGVYGEWQREGEVCNLIAHRLVNLSPWLGRLATASRDFR